MSAGAGPRLALALVACTACGGGSIPDMQDAGPGTLSVTDDATRLVPAAAPAAQEAAVILRDADGRPRPGVPVEFRTSNGAWVTDAAAVTDEAGRAATTFVAGPQPGVEYRLTAVAGALSAEFTFRTTPLQPGARYTGADGFIELHMGELPIIISVPHGGEGTPASLPDRTGDVTTVTDVNTIELAHAIADAFARRTGARPSLVISRLHRRKLDPNREIGEAAGGHGGAERAWREYHGFIEAAHAHVAATGRAGLYIDLHGHAHEAQRVELGYMLRANDLALSDETLETPRLVARSSLRAFVGHGLSHAGLVRGPNSLGTLLEQRGFPAVPSAVQPDPGLAPFFSGGYSTARHSSRDGSRVAGVQLEANRTGVRDSAANRRAFADALAAAVVEFLRHVEQAAVPFDGARRGQELEAGVGGR